MVLMVLEVVVLLKRLLKVEKLPSLRHLIGEEI